ncbi:MAG: GerMN domain-containing protein [Chloroflexota bacterium]|nr:GerMN domain-containing protein [Chloroflexota bacterium]
MRSNTSFVLLVVLLLAGGASCRVQIAPTPTPTLTSIPRLTATPTSAPSPTPTRTPAPTPTPTSEKVEVTVYFTDSDRYAEGTPPFEGAVSRFVDASSDLPEAVMRAFFEGPTEEERERGLELIASGFTGFSSLTIEDGIARIALTGECRSPGGVYTVAQPIMRNLRQFPEVEYVKIYDQHGNTQLAEGESDSIPACLEP